MSRELNGQLGSGATGDDNGEFVARLERQGLDGLCRGDRAIFDVLEVEDFFARLARRECQKNSD